MAKHYRRKPKYVKPKERTFVEWWNDQTERTRRTLMITGIAVVAVIVLLIVGYYGFYNDGSLVVRNGEVVGKQDNWLIAERTPGKNSKYYHLADVEAIEGFKYNGPLTTSINGANIKTDFTFIPEDENSPINRIYVSPVAARSPKEMAEYVRPTMLNYAGENGTVSEIESFNAPSGTGYWFNYAYSNTDTETGVVKYYQSAVMYVPCRYNNSSVLISINVVGDSEEVYMPTEELFNLGMKQINAITIIK